jgi:hypothetical protein
VQVFSFAKHSGRRFSYRLSISKSIHPPPQVGQIYEKIGRLMYTLVLHGKRMPPLPSCMVQQAPSIHPSTRCAGSIYICIDKTLYILWLRAPCRKIHIVRHEHNTNIPLLYLLRFRDMFFIYAIYSAINAGSTKTPPDSGHNIPVTRLHDQNEYWE